MRWISCVDKGIAKPNGDSGSWVCEDCWIPTEAASIMSTVTFERLHCRAYCSSAGQLLESEETWLSLFMYHVMNKPCKRQEVLGSEAQLGCDMVYRVL